MTAEAAGGEVRRRFLDERREICCRRFETLHAPVYDDRWGGYVNPTHERCVRDLPSRLAPDEPEETDDTDAPLVTGEVISGGAYHYYLPVAEATSLLHEAGFRVDAMLEGDGYAHFLLST